MVGSIKGWRRATRGVSHPDKMITQGQTRNLDTEESHHLKETANYSALQVIEQQKQRPGCGRRLGKEMTGTLAEAEISSNSSEIMEWEREAVVS